MNVKYSQSKRLNENYEVSCCARARRCSESVEMELLTMHSSIVRPDSRSNISLVSIINREYAGLFIITLEHIPEV